MNNLKYSNGSATYVESLEKKIAELEKQIVAIDMNNEPVAWIANDADLPLKEDGSYWLYPENPSKDNLYIPLYTHPVKELKLTKSEIEVLWEKHCPFDLTGGLAFARAILRKVQEK